VVVVEAELRSGSLITARLAGEQGREVFAVPGSPLDPRARGANDLIRQGATLVEEADDVLRVLDALPGLGDREPPPYRAAAPGADAAGDDLHARLEGLLSPAPIPIDELARAAGAPTSHVLAALMELALAGRVELMPGGTVAAP
jgi:DNA processing protein